MFVCLSTLIGSANLNLAARRSSQSAARLTLATCTPIRPDTKLFGRLVSLTQPQGPIEQIEYSIGEHETNCVPLTFMQPGKAKLRRRFRLGGQLSLGAAEERNCFVASKAMVVCKSIRLDGVDAQTSATSRPSPSIHPSIQLASQWSIRAAKTALLELGYLSLGLLSGLPSWTRGGINFTHSRLAPTPSPRLQSRPNLTRHTTSEPRARRLKIIAMATRPL